MAMRKRNGNGSEHDFQARLQALREDLEALQGDMKGLAGDVGDVAAERMNSALSDAMTSVQELTDRVEDWSNDNLESVRESVRAQPLAAIALSMGAGALLGAIFLKR
jgi:ElaB/YqjD/DUF883 family membrane-anchored ribosome-binding protein